MPDGQWIDPIVCKILAHYPGTHVPSPWIDFLDENKSVGGIFYFTIEYEMPVAPFLFFTIKRPRDRKTTEGILTFPFSSLVGGALIQIDVLAVGIELTPPQTFLGTLDGIGIIALWTQHPGVDRTSLGKAPNQPVVIIVFVQHPRQRQVLHIAYTMHAFGLIPGDIQTGQQNGHQDGHDGNNHQQFDQCESLCFHLCPSFPVINTTTL